jgi:hypothetical protein
MFPTRKTLVLASAFLMVVAAGCGGFGTEHENPGEITHQEDEISGCGGFEKEGNFFDVALAYCDAEILYWQYDAETETLMLADARVLLNCCGDHSMTIEEVEGVYVVTERDAPMNYGARCACMCVFDFTMEATGIPEGTIQLRIVLEVTDWEEGSGTVFEGELDLTQGSGSVIIDDTPIDYGCTDM